MKAQDHFRAVVLYKTSAMKSLSKIALSFGILFIALACGGGGSGSNSEQGSAVEGDGSRFSYRFKPSAVLPLKAGMTLTVRELATGGEVLTDSVALDDAALETLTLNFHLDKNYIFAVDMQGMPFLRTTIVASQIQKAATDNVLRIGAINAITTYLTGLLEQQFSGGRYLAKARFAGNVSAGNTLAPNATELLIQDILSQNFSGNVSNFSSLSYVNLENGSVQTTALFNERKNRINLLRLYSNKAYGLSSVTATESTAMRSLFNAFFDESNAQSLLAKLTDTNLPNLDPAGDQGSSLMSELAARDASQNFLFLSGNGVLSPDQLRQVFFTPVKAYDSLLLQITLSTPESTIAGSIAGPGAVGAEVILRTAAGNSQTTATSGSDGSFTFSQIPTGSYVLKVSSSGFVYTGSVSATQVVSANLQNISVSVQSSSLSAHLNPNELEWTGTQLRVKQGGVTSSHLAPSLSLSGNLSASSLRVGDLSFPRAGGNSGQMLQLTGSNQLGWAGLPAGFNGNYQNLSGQPTLFSGNYGDLVGVPTMPVIGSNVVSANVSHNITADWDNSAQAWTDAEVSDQLTLSSSNLSGVEITNSAANVNALTVTGSVNLSGHVWPTTGGTNGQLLATQGNGHLLWKSVNQLRALPTLGAGQLAMGNASGLATAVSLSGNASLTAAGVLSLSAGSIASAQVQDGSLTASDFTVSPVHSGNLGAANLQVGSSANLAGLYIPSTKGTVGQVLKLSAANTLTWGMDLTTGTLGTNTVTSLHLADGSVGSAQLASSSVSGAQVQDASLTAAEFSSSLSFTGNVQTGGNLVVTGSTNLGGLLFPSTMGSANQVLVSAGNGSLKWQTVDASLLGASIVTAQSLANDSVSTVKILDGSIVAGDISANAITSAKISAGAITASHIAADAVGNAALADNILLTTLTVSGNLSLGSSNSDNILITATLKGGASTGNLSFGGNLGPTGQYSLGTASHTYGNIYAKKLVMGNVVGTGSSMTLDVNSDAVPEMTILSNGNVGLGVSNPNARLQVSGNVKTTGLWFGSVSTVTNNLTLGAAQTTLVDTSSANITLTLPAASTLMGYSLSIKKINRDQGFVRVTSSSNIDGVSDVFLKNSAGVLPSIEVLSDGSTWHITERTGGTTEPQGGYMLVDVSGGPAASFYPVSYTNVTPDLTGTGNFTFKSNVIVLKWIPPGVFTMGNTTAGYGPEHEVTLTEGFWTGVFEVTQLQWLQVMAAYPSAQSYNNSGTNTDPLHNVVLEEIRGTSSIYNWPLTTAVAGNSFMGNLQAKTGLNFDLPTEAEWEYSCRAGTTTLWSFGSAENGAYMWYSVNNSPSGTKEVGGKLPNPWGLYDMHANVFEWCLDHYATYPSSSVSDPLGAINTGLFPRRGGSFSNSSNFAHSANRQNVSPGSRNQDQGIRVFVRPK
jgi:formylglycine-generating enzyme required for sulfatase activity